MGKPLVSVIIPAYNAEKTIEQTISSCLEQSFTDFELIVVNDGSTDATYNIIRGFSDKRLIMINQDNYGKSRSLNNAISIARGDYISVLDADDLWDKDKLSLQYEALFKNKDAGVAYSHVLGIDESGKIMGAIWKCPYEGNVFDKIIVSDFLVTDSNPLVRKVCLDKVGGYDESLKNGMDWDIMIRVANKYSFVLVPKELILYRIHQSGLSSNIENAHRDWVRVIHKAFKLAPEDMKKLKCLSLSNIYKYLVYKCSISNYCKRCSYMSILFILKAFFCNPKLSEAKIAIKVLLVNFLIIIMPCRISLGIHNSSSRFFNIRAITGFHF